MHCKLGPLKCSQCAGVPAKRVDVVDGSVTVDGVVTRDAQPESDLNQRAQNSRRRGGQTRTGRGKR